MRTATDGTSCPDPQDIPASVPECARCAALEREKGRIAEELRQFMIAWEREKKRAEEAEGHNDSLRAVLPPSNSLRDIAAELKERGLFDAAIVSRMQDDLRSWASTIEKAQEGGKT